MALADLMSLSKSKGRTKIGLSEERVTAVIPIVRQYIAYWREYPDMFVDYLQTGGKDVKKGLELRFYQRIFIRVAMRYRYVYAVYPRGYSKSFLAVLILILRAILYPGAKLFTAAGGKQQSAGILSEKMDELCRMVPAFEKELDLRPGKTRKSKDKVYYLFKNGSFIDNLAISEKTRGARRTAGVLEECASMDGQLLSEVIIPTMNVSRMCADGTNSANYDEILNQAQLYITTAGYKGTFAYQKLISVLVQMLTQPKKAFVLGGTWRVPVITGAQPKTFVEDLKRDDTFNEAAFEREYGSHWTGTVEGAFFDGEKYDRCRILQKPEYEASGKIAKQGYYVIAADIGRKGCQSAFLVFKVQPQAERSSTKSLVNIYVMEDQHMEDQVIFLKKLYYKYKARRIVVDANGIGITTLDYLVKKQVLPDGEIMPDFGVYNDDEGFYKKFRTNETELDAVYAIKANAPLNTEAYATVKSQIESGKLKLLVDGRTALTKLLGTKMGQAMTPEQRNEYVIPYKLTDNLKEELMNLREDNEGINIILKQASKKIPKDKFSALCYGLYYIKQEEDRKRKKKKFNAKEWKFYN